MVGAAYASGISGREIREHTIGFLGKRRETARRLMARGPGGISSLFDFNPFRAAFIDGEALLDLALPEGVARDFADLEIPTILIATDFYGDPSTCSTAAILSPRSPPASPCPP